MISVVVAVLVIAAVWLIVQKLLDRETTRKGCSLGFALMLIIAAMLVLIARTSMSGP